MLLAEYQIPRAIRRNADLMGKSVILRKPVTLEAVIPEIIHAQQKNEQVVCLFDQMDFALPDPNHFRTREVFSNDDLRGFRLRNGRYEVIVGDDAEFVYMTGDVQIASIEGGRSFAGNKSFRILQTFWDQETFENERERILKSFDPPVKKMIGSKRIQPQSGSTRLL